MASKPDVWARTALTKANMAAAESVTRILIDLLEVTKIKDCGGKKKSVKEQVGKKSVGMFLRKQTIS